MPQQLCNDDNSVYLFTDKQKMKSLDGVKTDGAQTASRRDWIADRPTFLGQDLKKRVFWEFICI